MPLEDKQLALKIRRQIAHIPIDISIMDVACRGNTIFLTGVVKRLPREKSVSDLRKAVQNMVEIIKTNPGIRDVITTYLRVAD